MVGNIAKRSVDALRPGADNVLLWDDAAHGFGVKCAPGGSKTYLVQYRVGRRTRRVTIGKHGSPWTPDSARREALRLLGIIAAGGDPQAEKQQQRDGVTVKDVAERFLAEHVEAKRKPGTAYEYRRLLNGTIIPALGSRAITDVARSDVGRLHVKLADTPHQANRVLAVISKLMTWSEARGLRPDGSNPCRHVEKYAEKKRERYLSQEELGRLGAALDAGARGPLSLPGPGRKKVRVRVNPFAVRAIGLLVLTGCRVSEILGLRWEDVDLAHGLLRLPDSKTGAKPVYLNAGARAVLKRIPRIAGNPHVIVGGKEGARLVNVKDSWALITKAARLEGVRLHDLRHSYASIGAGAGVSLPIVGRLLGHTQASTTQRYAHVAADPAAQAAELIGKKITLALGGGK